jgi:hypothetical protein
MRGSLSLQLFVAVVAFCLLATHVFADNMQFRRKTASREAISPDGTTIALAYGTKIQLFDLKTETVLGPLIDTGWPITTIAVAPDNKRIGAGGANRSEEDGAYFEYDGTNAKLLKKRSLGIGPVTSVKYIVTKDAPEGYLHASYDKPSGGR